MNLLTEAMNSLGAALLPVVAALLLEELTYGGLVRLLVAPWPGTGKSGAPGDGPSSLGCKGGERGEAPTPEGTPQTNLSLRRKLRRRIKANKFNKLRELREQKGEGK
jgi:hypothetical protein